MKKTLTIIGLAAFALAGITGCSIVPTSKIAGTYQGKPFAVQLPKDAEWKGLKVDVTTNSIHIEAESISAHNNPEAINSTAAGRVTIIDASGKLLGTAAGVAAQTAK